VPQHGKEPAVSPKLQDIPEEWLLGQFIPLHYHYNMLRDGARMDAFREAISCTVPAGGRVLELGGGTGVLSYFAAQQAEKVWCVERNPALARAARGFLANNRGGERVTVVQADALAYLPPEPVDVVICEMLHVALIREKQLDVLRSFKERYVARFGPRLPVFLPDAVLLAVQPVEQDFSFSGFRAPIPMFQPAGPHAETQPLAEAEIYSSLFYEQEFPTEFRWEGVLTMNRDGLVNALCFLTKSFLAFQLAERRAVEWLMHQLILPVAEPVAVSAGDQVAVRFSYQAGCPIEALGEALDVENLSRAISLPLRRAA
jgi:predicted RNA methylase